MTRKNADSPLFAMAALATFAVLPAAAQLYKCQGPDGKVVYSDQRCEAKATSSGVQGATNNANRPALPPPSGEKEKAGASATPGKTGEMLPQIPDGPVIPGDTGGDTAKPAGLTSGQQDRIRDLQTTISSAGSTAEAKAGAQLEIDSIRRGREERLSSDDRSRRESLAVDLGSVDKAKRQAALRELRNLYYR